MADREGQGAKLYAKAEKKWKKIAILSASYEKKYEDAADLFTQAGNQFKAAHSSEQAAKSYDKAAQCYVKLKSKHEAANLYAAAAQSYEHFDTKLAAKCLRLAADLLTEEGRQTMAAKHLVSLGELYEKESNWEFALEAYQQAAEVHRVEGKMTQAKQSSVKAAAALAMLERYDEAHELFEDAARHAVDDDLLKFSTKDYNLKAGLCYLAAGDILGAKHGLDEYRMMDPLFNAQREYKFLQSLVDAYLVYDNDAFTKAVHEYERVTRLGPWMTEMVVRIKLKLSKMETSLA